MLGVSLSLSGKKLEFISVQFAHPTLMYEKFGDKNINKNCADLNSLTSRKIVYAVVVWIA